MTDCIFCNYDKLKIVLENRLAVCIEDRYPVTEGHSLIIPKRHMEGFFNATNDENIAIHDLIRNRKEQLQDSDPTIDGFNIGVNCGESAGQTIFHLHWHLIPRRSGDIVNPAGGVRGVIPSKRIYT